MNNLIKIIIPLLNDDFTYEDFDEKSGFTGAYFSDINRPSLVYHIFIMYDAECKENGFVDRIFKLDKMKNLYSHKIIYVNRKPYHIFTFTISPIIDRIRMGFTSLNVHQKKKVLDFWWHKDEWVVNNILLDVSYVEPDKLVVPEEDYRPEFTLKIFN